MLNTDTFIICEDEYDLYEIIWRKTRKLSAVTGCAHFFKKVDSRWGLVKGHVMQFAKGMVDFVEILDNIYLDDPELYYEMLNMGFMIPVTAGTDYPYGLEVGDNRTYVYLEKGKPVTPDLWTGGIRKGRTFIALPRVR